jgi:hypothetical protein
LLRSYTTGQACAAYASLPAAQDRPGDAPIAWCAARTAACASAIKWRTHSERILYSLLAVVERSRFYCATVTLAKTLKLPCLSREMVGDRTATHHAGASPRSNRYAPWERRWCHRGVGPDYFNVSVQRRTSLGTSYFFSSMSSLILNKILDSLLPKKAILEQGSMPLREATCLSCHLFRMVMFEQGHKRYHEVYRFLEMSHVLFSAPG